MVGSYSAAPPSQLSTWRQQRRARSFAADPRVLPSLRRSTSSRVSFTTRGSWTERTVPSLRTDVLDHRKVAAARVFAASRYPYLASALFAAQVHPAEESGTIAVDRGWQIHADPAVLDRMAVDELGRLLVHLVSHVLRDHATRAGRAGVGDSEGDPRPGTRQVMRRSTTTSLPARWCLNVPPACPRDLGADDGRLVEEYYRLVRGARRQWDCGSGSDGVARPWDTEGAGDGLTERDREFLRLGVASELHRSNSSEPGSVAAGWLRWAERILPSQTDWRRVLAAEVQAGVVRAAGMVDYSYRRPSRRSESTPSVIMPTLDRPLPDVAIVCDTSGSMTEGLLAQALAEVEALLQRVGLRGTNVRVLSCDAQVHSVRPRESCLAGRTDRWRRHEHG